MKRVVRELRDLVPLRPLTQAEELRIAENQANRLLSLAELNGPPFPEEVIRRTASDSGREVVGHPRVRLGALVEGSLGHRLEQQ